MRYIPEIGNRHVLQVPEDKNSYINVKNNDARGLANIFSGSVLSRVESVLTIGGVTDGGTGTLEQYREDLSQYTELQAHIYRTPSTADDPIITVANTRAQSVDFSDSPSNAPTLGPLRYYIFGYNVNTGQMPHAVQVVGNSGTQYTKVLNPDLWGTDQYFDIVFNRTSQYVLPVIYRVWGSNAPEFLGVIGNAKVGYPGSSLVSFRDYGLTEIPNWNNDPSKWTPDFMEDVFSIVSGAPVMTKKILGKEHLRIKPTITGTAPSYIQCEPAESENLVNVNTYQAGDTIKFVVDDTKPIRDAISLAASGGIKEIFFPAGTYYLRDSAFINTALTDYSNLSFRGVGEGSIIKRVPSTITTSTNPGLLSFVGQRTSPRVRGIRFRSLVFDGNRSSNFSVTAPTPGRVTNEDLISLRYADSVAITECRFIENFGAGVRTTDSSSLILTNCTFSNLGRSYEPEINPINIVGSENAVVQGNIFEFCTAGPYFFGTDFSTINNNIIRSCGDSGVILETSYQWNATSNLAYSDTDSLIRSVDQYNNEYSKALIEILRGVALEPIYYTVTNGGESVGIIKDSIEADIYKLDFLGKKSANKVGSFKVLQTIDQLEAGIFSITLPGIDSVVVGGETIPATASFATLDPRNNEHGYMYEIRATVKLGQGSRGFTPVSIRNLTRGGVNYLAIKMKNSSDILSMQVYSAGSTENDKIMISGFSNTDLSGWDTNTAYTVIDIDTDSNSLLINTIPTLSPGVGGIPFLGGKLFVVRSNYQIADGNILVN